VHRLPDHGFQAVQIGFSWLGFFFPPIWLFVKELYFQAVAVLLLLFTFRFVDNLMQLDGALNFTGTIATMIIVGVFLNKWKLAKLRWEGYQYISSVECSSSMAAISEVLLKSQQVVGANHGNYAIPH